MESEQERFIHTMDMIELEVSGLEQHKDLTMVERVANQVGDISAKITDAENKGRQDVKTTKKTNTITPDILACVAAKDSCPLDRSLSDHRRRRWRMERSPALARALPHGDEGVCPVGT